MAIKNQVSKPDPGNEKELPWLFDVNLAAQILTGLSLGSSAQAALITRNEILWAYAGQLPQKVAKELGEALARYWDSKSESDLVRFIRLETTAAEHMLYATRLAKGMVLSLVFDAETPFSTIRSQANQLVRSLSTSPSDGWIPQVELNSIDPTSPEPPANFKINYPLPGPEQIGQPDPASIENKRIETPQANEPLNHKPSFTLDIPEEVLDDSHDPAEQAEEGGFEATYPAPASETGRRVKFESDIQTPYNLNYACLLIPRFPNHLLKGDLALNLTEWVPKLCIAFGWRLEYLSIRPEYLQWIINVPPTTAPGFLMRIVRQHISEKIFNDFPRLKFDNPSGDFWAPGYVLMGGTHPHPAQIVQDFIQQTRQRQGIS